MWYHILLLIALGTTFGALAIFILDGSDFSTARSVCLLGLYCWAGKGSFLRHQVIAALYYYIRAPFHATALVLVHANLTPALCGQPKIIDSGLFLKAALYVRVSFDPPHGLTGKIYV